MAAKRGSLCFAERRPSSSCAPTSPSLAQCNNMFKSGASHAFADGWLKLLESFTNPRKYFGPVAPHCTKARGHKACGQEPTGVLRTCGAALHQLEWVQALGELHINSDFNFDHADKDVFASETFFSASAISLFSGIAFLTGAFSNSDLYV